jgi:hypothetical protein
MGGFPRGLAADPALHLGRLARQVRPHALKRSLAGSGRRHLDAVAVADLAQDASGDAGGDHTRR